MLKEAAPRRFAGWRPPAYRLTPLLGRLHGRLGLEPTLASTAARSWTVSPASSAFSPEAFYEPEDLQKITGVAPDYFSTIAEQVQNLGAGWREHRATTAHELRDVVIAQAHVFTRRLAFRIDTTRAPWLAPRIAEEHEEGVLANSSYGIRYFGHWLTDDLPLTLAAQALGPPVSLMLRPTAQQTDYLRTLGLELPAIEAARFKKLVVIADVGQNPYKAARYARLRDLLRGDAPVGSGRPVLLLRGTGGAPRLLANEQQVAAALAARGFDVFDPAQESVSRVVRACMDNELVVGVEGSQLAHGVMWMKPGGTLLVLQPPQRFNAYFKQRCDVEGMRFAFIVGDPQEGGAFSIDVSRLQRLLDRLA